MSNKAKDSWYRDKRWQLVLALTGCLLLLALADKWYNSGRPTRNSLAQRQTQGAETNSNAANSVQTATSRVVLPDDFQGSLQTVEQRKDGQGGALLKDVRTGSHEKYDRAVFEFAGDAVPGYHVEYVDSYQRRCANGDEYRTSGASLLLVRLSPAVPKAPTLGELIEGSRTQFDYPTLKLLQPGCDDGNQIDYVLNLSERKPFRAAELANPARLVVDIKH